MAKVESIIAVLQPEMERRFEEGPPYSLTELQGLHAANQLGAEGKDASILWEQEIKARYRSNHLETEQALRAEVSGYSDSMLEDILAILVPKSRNSRWKGLSKTTLIGWDFGSTHSARIANFKAVCESLKSTPSRWANLYPDRAPFTFERFGIDRKLIESWCTEK